MISEVLALILFSSPSISNSVFELFIHFLTIIAGLQSTVLG